MNNDKRVILITGDGKKWYEQAIFIVRKDCPQKDIPRDVISEAEWIVNNYLSKLPAPSLARPLKTEAATYKKPASATQKASAKKSSSFDFTLNLLMFMCCAALAALLLYTNL